MDILYLPLSVFSGGVIFFGGWVFFFPGLQKGEKKVYPFFGFFCFCFFFFFFSPPMGFILHDLPPYPVDVKIKRVFNLGFFCLFPWFAVLYTGYFKRTLPILINIVFLSCYTLMLFTSKSTNSPLWVLMSLFAMLLSMAFGFIAVRFQFRNGEK